MTQSNDDKFETRTPKYVTWMANNARRIRLVHGFLTLWLSGILLAYGQYANSVTFGVLGGLLVGGWPALRRLLRYPRWQLTHWYCILINARKIQHTVYPDSARVSKMEPTRHGWREVERLDD